MYYINAISSITHQESFENPGFSASLTSLDTESTVIDPDYKKYIDPKLIRRMSKILRMGVSCAKSCLEQAGVEAPEAIIVGTGLGCLTDTMKFLETYIQIDGLLPPTSFIQSTHNTIAGQISLSLKNHGYNTTYTQNNVSFELALQDAMLSLDEGMDNVLVGAADEYIPFFKETPFANLNLTSGATFILLSKNKTANTVAQIEKVGTSMHVDDVKKNALQFLEEVNVPKSELDYIYQSSPFNEPDQGVDFGVAYKNINALGGVYPTNAAFALHVAADQVAFKKVKRVLICNHLTSTNLGLTLIQAVE